jgi:hypothetical protein
MPETTQILYSHKELTELILRDRGITAGHWAIYITFRLVGANLGLEEGDLKPVAMTFVESIGVTRVPEPNPLSVDASKLRARRPVSRGLSKGKSPAVA